MKKFLLKLCLAVVLTAVLNTPAFAGQPIKVLIEGKPLNSDVSPVLIQGRVLVPLRAAFESLGVKVEWDSKTQTVNADKNDFHVQLAVNDSTVNVNGYQEELDVPPQIIDGRVLVPLRFAGEAFGAVVHWDSKTSTANIYYRKPTGLNFTDVTQVGTIDYNEYFYPDSFILLSDGSYMIQGDEIGYDEIEDAYFSKYLIIYFHDAKSGKTEQVIREEWGKSRYQGWFSYQLVDGRIIVERYLEEGNEIKTIYFDFNPKTGELNELLTLPEFNQGDISVKGETVYSLEENGQFDLYKIDLLGKITRLTSTTQINETQPLWSPDGERTAYISVPVNDSEDVYSESGKISIINSDGTQNIELNYPKNSDWSYSWSPDGQYITYSYLSSDQKSPNEGIWVVKTDGSSGRLINNNPDITNPNFSPDSNKISAQINLNNDWKYILMDHEGTLLDSTIPFTGNAWSPDGKMLLYNRYGEVWIWDVDNDKANAAFVANPDIIKWSPDQKTVYLVDRNIVWKSEITR